MPLKKQKRMDELPELENTLVYKEFNDQNPAPKGKWNSEVFENNHPIVLELACGKGEYSVGLGQLHPENNYVGLDIKGNRMWVGATKALDKKLKNVRFLRCFIDHLDQFFAPDEVDEAWILFPDPYDNKERKRLTSPKFLKTYRKVMKPDAVIHLKTDSTQLYEYTKEVIEEEGLEVLDDEPDVHRNRPNDKLLSIKTYYERQHIKKGKKIKYLSFRLNHK
ncbi:MAG: tRNA (guanosine(46)-N7)-methyltransferase TrmB [Gracilimonas sp.]